MTQASLLRRFAVLGVLLLLASTREAQTVRGLQGTHRDGQTFLTWNELNRQSYRYRVYRSDMPIRRAADLNFAVELGEVEIGSSYNRPRSVASGVDFNWIIQPGGAELANTRGLFVHTLRATGTPSTGHYAVMIVASGLETRKIVADQNTASVAGEVAAPPQPVIQQANNGIELWAHWTSHVDTPFQPALSLVASHGHNFLFHPGTTEGPRGLLVRLHAAGQQYTVGWPHPSEVQQDVDVLALSDYFPIAGWTLWVGAQDAYPMITTDPGAQVHLVTLRRAMWTVDWMVERLGAAHDPDRLYAVGGSMGAMGSFYLASEFPDRFAAILARNGNYDVTAPDVNNMLFVENLLGDFAFNLTIAPGMPSSGLRIFDRMNVSVVAPFPADAPGPVIRTINGRNDMTVGWSSAPALYRALAETQQPAVHYFDDRSHNPFGYWMDAEEDLLERTFATRRNLPSLHFGGLTIDDNPGTGSATEGDLIGCLSCYVDYDPQTAFSDSQSCRFDVFLRNQGALDDAPLDRAHVVLTPGRTGPFSPEPGTPVLFTLTEGPEPGVLVDTQILLTDGNGRVHTGEVEVTITPRKAVFARLEVPPLFPRIDFFEALPAVVEEGESAVLTWTTSNSAGVTLDNGIGAVAAQGSMLVTPLETTTYLLSTEGDGGSASASATVTVRPVASEPELDVDVRLPGSIRRGATFQMVVSIVNSGTTSSDTLTVTVDVTGNGEVDLRDPRSSSQNVPAVSPGGRRSAFWSVRVRKAGTATVTVTVTDTSGAVLGTVTKSMQIQG